MMRFEAVDHTEGLIQLKTNKQTNKQIKTKIHGPAAIQIKTTLSILQMIWCADAQLQQNPNAQVDTTLPSRSGPPPQV